MPAKPRSVSPPGASPPGVPKIAADFAVTRGQASRWVAQGITLADFLQAFRIGQLTLWQGVLDAAGSDPVAREAALSVVTQVIELGRTVAGEACLTAQQDALAEHDRVRRDLLEDLLAGRPPTAGPKRHLMSAAVLGPNMPLLVAVATLTAALPEGLTLQDAVGGVTQDTGWPGLTAVRQDEIIGIMPLPARPVAPARAARAVEHLRRSNADLERRGIKLAVGVSSMHARLVEVPEAYAEARTARDGLGGSPGVLARPAS
jgi:GGDEF-like domain